MSGAGLFGGGFQRPRLRRQIAAPPGGQKDKPEIMMIRDAAINPQHSCV
jgi:hypothetical protein